MNLAEEFALLAYADDGTTETDGTRLTHGLSGALLVELTLAGRVEVADKKVVVLDPTPTGDALVDSALQRITADPKTRRPGHWVSKFAADTRGRVLAKLVEDEVLRVEKDRVLLIFPRTRYPSAYGGEPAAETEARTRMRWAVLDERAADPRTAALCALVAATGLDRKVFADLDRELVERRLKVISEGSWAADAVKHTIEEIQTALTTAAVTAATTAPTGT